MEPSENQKSPYGEIIVPKSKLSLFIENIWYHYKWHIIIIAFFVLVFGVCFVQCLGTEQPDVVVTYAGGYTLSSSEVNTFNQIFKGLLNKSANGAESIVALTHYSIYTQDELYQMYYGDGTEENGAASLAYNSARQANVNNASQFSSFLLTGETAILFVSEWVYQNKINTERMMTLDSVLGYTPKEAVDAYAVKLCDTELYKSYEALQVLPKDTLILFARPTVAGATADEDVYAIHKELFRSMIEYQP